jgi:hypothetical protein
MTLIAYLFNRLFYRLTELFRHWYVNSFRLYSHFIISLLERLDRILAVKITLKHLSEPLYQDRSVIGYLLGFIFRSLRLLIGGVVYLIFITVAVILYLLWLSIPAYIIYKIIEPFSRL